MPKKIPPPRYFEKGWLCAGWLLFGADKAFSVSAHKTKNEAEKMRKGLRALGDKCAVIQKFKLTGKPE